MYGGLDNILVIKGQHVHDKEIISEIINNKHTIIPSLHYAIFHTKEWDPGLKKSTLSYISINPYEFVYN